MVIIAFYYLLHVGEYTTKAQRKKCPCTQQFWTKDVTLFHCNKSGELVALQTNASDEQLLATDAAKLQISN